MKEITIEELDQWKSANSPHMLIDVREDFERAVFHIGGEWIPLGEVLQHTEKIPSDIPVLFYCRRGVRSAIAIQKLEEKTGYTNFVNLKGGIGG